MNPFVTNSATRRSFLRAGSFCLAVPFLETFAVSNVVDAAPPKRMVFLGGGFGFTKETFYPKEAGDYVCTIMMMPFTGEPDFRIYTISSKVVTPPKETSLDFKAPARQVVTQEVRHHEDEAQRGVKEGVGIQYLTLQCS